MTFQDVVTKNHEALLNAQVERFPEIISRFEIAKSVPEDTPGELCDGLMQKAVVGMLKRLLDADPALNQRFLPQVKSPLLQQLLVAARVKELSKARIVRKGGRKQLRFDVSEVAATFYGKQLMKSAGLDRQRVLDKDELEKLNVACEKVKLKLPESIESTTTERFFEEAASEEQPAKEKR